MRAAVLAASLVSLSLGGCSTFDAVASAEPGSLNASAGPSVRGDAAFRGFVEGVWPEARARGVSRATFDNAFAGVSPDPKVIALTRRQAEFAKPIWDYVQGAVSSERIARGRAAAASWSDTLAAIERRHGVERSVVLGVWGMETNFGSFFGDNDVIRALATLASEGYRGTFFKDELVNALVILQQGHVSRSRMIGSWAGAMGHTQFMPSSFLQYAVDWTGDGRKDIWGSIPDALASTANYLKSFGWKPGLPWGFEVTLPASFDFRNADRKRPLTFAQWTALGLKRPGGRAMPAGGEAALFLPAGARGPVFLVTSNFDVIKKYNNSDAYALAVAHLGDRVTGGGALVARWPTDEPNLDGAQRNELQQRLKALGYYDGEIDGRLGSGTRDAVRSFQLARGLTADGFPGIEVLRQLRTAR